MYLKYKFRQTMEVTDGASKNVTNFTNKVKLHTSEYTTQITDMSTGDATAQFTDKMKETVNVIKN